MIMNYTMNEAESFDIQYSVKRVVQINKASQKPSSNNAQSKTLYISCLVCRRKMRRYGVFRKLMRKLLK